MCTSQNNKLNCGVHCVSWLKTSWDGFHSDLPKQNHRLWRAAGDPCQPDDSVIVLQKLIALTLLFKISVSFICHRVPLPGNRDCTCPLVLKMPCTPWPLWDLQMKKNLLSFGLWKHKASHLKWLLVIPIKNVAWAPVGWHGGTERSLGRAQLHLGKEDSRDTDLTSPVTAFPQQWFLVH